MSAAAAKSEQKISANKLPKNLINTRIAVITIGRWQPPHAGHFELIDGTYHKVLELRKQYKYVDGYIWITPRPDEEPGKTISSSIIKKNPLYFIDKWFYLNLMLPHKKYGKDFKFLTISDYTSDINHKIFQDPDIPSASLLRANHSLKDSTRRKKLLLQSSCLQEKADFMVNPQNKRQRGRKYKTFLERSTARTQKIRHKHFSGSPSATCINYLKAMGYSQLYIIVGSDRVEAFKKWNDSHLDEAFGVGMGSIERVGGDRGDAGKGLLFNLDDESDDGKSDSELAVDLMEQCSMTGHQKGQCDSEEEKRAEGKQNSIAGKYSGTRIRNCAYKVTDLDYFCEGTTTNGKTGSEKKRLGIMTTQLSYCLLNDIRKRAGLSPILIQEWNENVSVKYRLVDDYFSIPKQLSPSDEQYSRVSLALAGAPLSLTGGKRKTRKNRKKRKRKSRKRKIKKTRKKRKKRKRKYTRK